MEPLIAESGDSALPMARPRMTRLRGGADDGGAVSIGVGAALCCVPSVLFLILTVGTAAIVKPNFVGIKRNTITNQVDMSRVYHAGRHWFQPFTSFVLFPTTVQNVQMELTTRTTEGYPLNLKSEFQYQLQPEKIIDLYSHYTIKYEPVFQRNVRAEIMKAMSEYDARALFTNRVSILKDMESRVDRVLRESYATCWGVQFDDVMQPKAFEKTLLLTQLQEWFSKQKLAEQKISAIQAGTQVLEAEFKKNISVVSSTASQRCKYIISQATAHASNYQNEAKSNATLLTDKAKAEGSAIQRETEAAAELRYQMALAKGDSSVLKEKAQATMRSTKLEGLRLKYWTDEIGLSQKGLVNFQKMLGSYEKLENVTFLFGFENSYASADASSTDASSAPPQSNAAHAQPNLAEVATLANAVMPETKTETELAYDALLAADTSPKTAPERSPKTEL